jgi:hypothetical protein
VYSWAIGGANLTFPADVGLPLGGANRRFDYLLLDVHYNTPSNYPGAPDNSGFEILTTTTLRAKDAAIIAVGELAS